jgi:murein DD-endopeptidase MepM/ murein hydrolase activator NlpD
VDLAAPSGTPIKAVGAGTVVAAAWCDCGLGYYVEIDHGDGTHSVYGHMASQPTVATGQTVNQGDLIGQVGSTGLSTGPHLHFMIRQDGATQDPKSYLPPLGG